MAGVIALCIALITTLIFADLVRSAPSTNKPINFQGRLLTSSGGTVPDGHYNMQFKIYEGGSGNAVNNPGGALRWTENYVNNGSSSGAVQVKNGFFSVSLGSVNPFGSSVDWDADTLWLSMNVAGRAVDCTTFGSGSCGADGEMLPMKRITATPYALNAGAVGGKTADNFVQLAQGVQTDASSNTSSIFINKTGTGNLIRLQNGSVDVFTVSGSGDLTLGTGGDKTISVGTSGADTDGRSLTISGGEGGSGVGSNGGDLVLQGGEAGGSNGGGGDVLIDAGSATGSGTAGSIAIGSTNAGTITIGSTAGTGSQNIAIGSNNTPGSTTNITIGSGGDAASGTTDIQAKNTVSISTNGETRAVFADTNTVYFGNGVSSAAPDDYTIQGTNSTNNSVAGGSLTVQGGNATTGDANGGNVVLSGGTGSGSGANGLVVMTTPAFSTVSNDASCYAGGALVASSCSITKASIDGASAILVGFSAGGQTATVPDPTNTTPGRIMYIMAAGSSETFTLSVNGGGSGNLITMRQNTATSLIWNGSDWIVAGGSSATSLQDAYTNTPQSTVTTDIILSSGSSGGLTIQDSVDTPVNGRLLDVKNSAESSLFSINSSSANHATDGGVHTAADFNTNWPAVGTSSTVRTVSDGHDENDSAQVAAGTTANNGIGNKLSVKPKANTVYRATVYAKLESGSPFADFKVIYSPDNASFIDCTNYNTQTISPEWTKVVCDITTDATEASNPHVYFVQPSTPDTARTFLVDAFSFTLSGSGSPSVQIGGGDETTLFTLDASSSAPSDANSEALLGSMYYDTTLGRVQCYEAEGWGSCGASPDSFMTLSPEYANAVMNGNQIGVMTSDICSDTLDINDGSSAQPTICGTNETYNFYNWTSPETSPQTNSIYVTYQLPAVFKEFVSGTTAVMGRTDSGDASVNYQIYRNNGSSGLTPCGSETSVSSGPQTAWQSAIATGYADPSTCGFTAGDSIVIRINLTAANNANAYVSNLNFTFSNH